MIHQNKIRVLIFADWYYPTGGIEVFLSRLIGELGQSIEIGLAIREFRGKSDLSALEKSAKIFRIKSCLCGKIRKIIDEFSPDVIHINNVMALGLAALRAGRKRKIPVILTAHQIPAYKNTEWPLFRAIAWSYIRWFADKFDLITAPSNTVASLMKRNGVEYDPLVISCGVDTEKFCTGDKAESRRLLGFLENNPVILYVGRFEANKDLNLLIKAGGVLKSKINDFKIVLVGFDGAKRQFAKLQKLAERNGIKNRIINLGFIPNDSAKLPLVYRAADVFVIASYFETQSIVTIEALASGLPVIASESGALPELVVRGQNGLLFRPGDFSDLAEKLEFFFKHPEGVGSMEKAARNSALPHSLRVVSEKWLETYRKLSKQTG